MVSTSAVSAISPLARKVQKPQHEGLLQVLTSRDLRAGGGGVCNPPGSFIGDSGSGLSPSHPGHCRFLISDGLYWKSAKRN